MATILVGVDARQCTRCGDVWPKSDFTPRGTICSYCKAAARGRKQANGDDVERGELPVAIKLKYCRACGENLPVDQFNAPQSKECKSCTTAYEARKQARKQGPSPGDILREAWYLYSNNKPVPESHIRAMHTDLVAKRRRGEVLSAKEKEALHNIEWMYEQRAKQGK